MCGDFVLDDELDRHFTQLEPMQCCQDETITTSAQFISELIPSDKFGIEMMSTRKTARICRSFRGYMIAWA